MSAVTYSGPVMDITATKPIPFARLVRIELRKMVDTRAGIWLLISTAVVTAIVLIIQLWVGVAQDMGLSMRSFMIGMNSPMGVFLPVLGIMSVTSEWGQRTALTSFALVPSRGKVMGAKFVGMMFVAVAAILVGSGLAALANVAFAGFAGTDAIWNLDFADFAKFSLLHVIGMATGFAFGTMLLNTAAAIVIFFVYSFVLPPIIGVGALLVSWIADIQPWVDFSFAQTPLFDGSSMNGEAWAQLGTSGLIWLVLPLLIGLWRVFRAEVK